MAQVFGFVKDESTLTRAESVAHCQARVKGKARGIMVAIAIRRRICVPMPVNSDISLSIYSVLVSSAVGSKTTQYAYGA